MRKAKRPQWLTSKLTRLIKKRNAKWRQFNKKKYSTWQSYKDLRNAVTTEIRKAKHSFETKLAKKVRYESKYFYDYININKKGKNDISVLLCEDGSELKDSKEMCSHFNEYFASVFTPDTNMQDLPEVKIPGIGNIPETLSNITVTSEMVNKSIKELKDDKSPGFDDMSSNILIKVNEQISEPLSYIFNLSIETSEIPEDWKTSKVIPIFKKGNKKLSSNYRPISLTSQVGKVLERILKHEISKFLEMNNLIIETQHGFREKKSTLSNLLEFSTELINHIDNRQPVDVAYLDFQKAFDKIPHLLLLKKIEAHGIEGKMLKWLESWLTNRKQRVSLQDELSDWTRVCSGVPQGSVLGPLLFIIYINDLGQEFKSSIYKFADDTKALGTVDISKGHSTLHDDLLKFEKWSQIWKMPLNVEKCKVVHYGNNNPNIEHLLFGKKLTSSTEEKDLGVLFNKDMSVTNQCLKASKSANKVLGIISRNIFSRDSVIMINLYKSLVRPILDYCNQIWKPYLIKDIKILEKPQKRFTKMVKGLKKLKYKDRLDKLKLTTLETRGLRGDLILTYKLLNGSIKSNINAIFDFNNRISRGHTKKLSKEYCRLESTRNSFSYRVVDKWNALTNDLITVNTVNQFKGGLDCHLKENWGLI